MGIEREMERETASKGLYDATKRQICSVAILQLFYKK